MSNKFETAKLFDSETQAWRDITPDQYNADHHAGHIECPEEGCHASLHYVRSHFRDACNGIVGAYFITNPHGDPHSDQCQHTTDEQIQTKFSMMDALNAGRFIVLNVNFPISYSLVKISPKFARAAMENVGGHYFPDWKKQHRGKYTSYSGHSLGKIISDMSAFKQARQEVGLDSSRLMVSYRHGVIPANRVYVGGCTQSGFIKASDIFAGLYGELQEKEHIDSFWRAAPALKRGMKLISHAKITESNRLFELPDKTIEVDGKRFKLQNVLDIRDSGLRQCVQAAKNISVIATPFIERRAIDRALSEDTGYMHLVWPVTNENQLLLS